MKLNRMLTAVALSLSLAAPALAVADTLNLKADLLPLKCRPKPATDTVN
jgi:hypothetical protein